MEDIKINELVKVLVELGREKNFGYNKETINVAEKFALIHSEVSEAYDAYRKKRFENTKDGFNQEVADIILRTLHLCGCLEVDINQAIIDKMNFNKNRTWDFKNMNERKN